MLRRDAGKEELPVPCPDKALGPRHRLPSAPMAISKSADHQGLVA